MYSAGKVILIIALSGLATFACRAFPFVVFGRKKEVPPLVKTLGENLPFAVIASLVVYCLKGMLYSLTNIAEMNVMENIYTLIAVAIVVVTHLWKKNTILSIAVGTVAYMILLHI